MAHNNPINGIDPSGENFLPTTLGAVAIAVGIAALDVAVVVQVQVHYRKYFGFTQAERAAAIQENQIVMASLRRIIDSDGDVTFQDEGIGVAGTMGTRMLGNTPYQHMVNLFEELGNLEGWLSGAVEYFSRLGNRGIQGVPDEYAQTPDQRAELAKALLYRHGAFDAWLRRNY